MNNPGQVWRGESHRLDIIASSKVFKESIDGLFTAAVEDVDSTNAKSFEPCALLREMTQPAELLAAKWMVVATFLDAVLFINVQMRKIVIL